MKRTSSAKSPKTAKGPKPRRGPGRPSAARIEQINSLILEEAVREFYRQGYQNARMETIASAAHVSKGTLYDRYPTKEALLSAVISQHVAKLANARGPRETSTSSDIGQQLKHRAHQLAECFCSKEFELLERLFVDSPSINELKRLQYEIGHKQTMDAIAQEILDRQSLQTIDREAAVQIAELLTAMLYGWWRTQKEYGRPALQKMLSYADYAVDVLLEGRSAWNRRSSSDSVPTP